MSDLELTKHELVNKIKFISEKWYPGILPGEDGNAGRTLEELLGIPENNLFNIPDYKGQFQIKSQRDVSKSGLITIHRCEPKPDESIPRLFSAMNWYNMKEKRKKFYLTISGKIYTIRGFKIVFDNEKFYLEFSPEKTKKEKQHRAKDTPYNTYGDWLDAINMRKPHYSEILPLWWNKKDYLDDLKKTYDNCLFVLCKVKKIDKKENFKFNESYILQGFETEKFEDFFEQGILKIDINSDHPDNKIFHNRGVGLRIARKYLFDL